MNIERPAGRDRLRGVGERAHAGSTENDGATVIRRNNANGGCILNLSCLSPFHLHLTDSRTGRKEVDGDHSSDYERNNNLNPFRGGLKP